MKFFRSEINPPSFGNFLEIHPFWYTRASLSNKSLGDFNDQRAQNIFYIALSADYDHNDDKGDDDGNDDGDDGNDDE